MNDHRIPDDGPADATAGRVAASGLRLVRPSPALRTTDDLCQALGIGFSDEQLEAITAPLEPGVIIAGAGSGKTTVMAARVVWLVGTGQVQPHQVLGLTFTRKAAAELSQRVRSALQQAGVVAEDGPDDAGEEVVMTYDAFAARLVGDHGLRIAVETDPTMITGAARYRLATRAVTSAAGPFDHLSRLRPASVTERVLQLDAELTAHLVSADQVREFTREYLIDLQNAPLYRGRPYAAIAQAEAQARERLELLTLVADYQDLKHSLGLVEFADQMAVAADLVRRVPAVSAALREQFAVVLLDEYQDTSSAQAALLQGLFSGSGPAHGLGHPVTAVGDPWQAIYGWRGAAASNILTFADTFRTAAGDPARSFTLSVNRRSGQQVLDVANSVAMGLLEDPALTAHGSRHTPIRLRAPQDAPAAHVSAATFESWAEEVAFIADRIVDDHRAGRAARWSDIAVLVRRNADVAPLHAALVAREVPVEIVGLGGLLRLPEIADVVATLTLIDDVTANPAVVRLLTGPRWRIGPRDLLALGVRAAELAGARRPGGRSLELDEDLAEALSDVDATEVVSLLDAVDDPGEAPLSPQARERVAAFGAELHRLRQHGSDSVLDLTRRVISTLGLDVELSADSELVAADRRAQLATFVDAVASYSDVDGDDSLGGLLAWLDAELEHGVGLDQALPTQHDSVKLLTVHRAKGLEWEVVYLPALVDGVFPSERVTSNWVKTSAAVPAPLRGDADAIPQAEVSKAGFDAYAEALKQAEGRSEDRLAYVAITRAKRHLTATGHTWRSGVARPRKPSRYLQQVMVEAAEQDAVLAVAPPVVDANPTDPVTMPLPWPVAPDVDRCDRLRTLAEEVQQARRRHAETGSWEPAPGDPLPLDLEAMVAGWDADLDMLMAQAAASDAPVVEVNLPPSMSASAVMAAMADPEAYAAQRLRPMPRPATRAATLGTRFHEWVERRFAGPAPLEHLPDLEPSVPPGPSGTNAATPRDTSSLGGAYEVEELTGRTDAFLWEDARRSSVVPGAPDVPSSQNVPAGGGRAPSEGTPERQGIVSADAPRARRPLADPTDWPEPDLASSTDPLQRLVDSFLASDYADRVPLVVEQPFVLVLGDQLVRGRIDAVYRSSGPHDYQVVDWKTSQGSADPVQLSLYRLAWAQLAGVPVERVDAVFVHVAGMRVERPRRLLDEEQLVAWLARPHGGSDVRTPDAVAPRVEE